MSKPTITLGEIIDRFQFQVVYGPEGYRERQITIEDVNRPGLPLAGFVDYFDKERLQVLGLAETNYLKQLTPEQRESRYDGLFAFHTPATIFARGLLPGEECMRQAKRHGQPILSTQDNTADVASILISYLRMKLSPRITSPGVLVEVYGEGILLTGESGIGKSETAIELVKRGHRLIADDAVEIRRDAINRLIGSAPELIRHYIELRGIGVVDVRRLFGMSAVKRETDIELVVNLENWRADTSYDRLGVEDLFTTILGVRVPTMTIPVKPGRNLAVIIEVAAANNRDKRTGYNAALEFTRQVDEHLVSAQLPTENK